MKENYLFVDGGNLLHRSFHSMSEMRRMDGQRNGALHGFLRSLSWIRNELDIRTKNAVVFWDAGRAQGRYDLFPQYKEGREPKDDREREQREDVHRQADELEVLLQLAGIRQIKVPGCEADDLIAIFAHRLGETGGTAVVYSGDHDMHQLIRPWIKVYDPKRSILRHPDLEEMWGTINVHRLAQIKAIMGDKSDSIDGVKTVGIKWAAKLLPYFDNPTDEDPLPRTDLEVDPKHVKKLDKVLKDQELVKRNYLLIRLPCNWGESFYSQDQTVEALTQWLIPSNKNLIEFLKRLRENELETVAENIHRW